MIHKADFQFMIAFRDFLSMWAENEIGTNLEFNDDNIVAFMNSEQYAINYRMEVYSERTVFDVLTQYVLDGHPLFHFFKIPEKKLKLLEKEFQDSVIEEETQRINKFVCLRCKHLKTQETSFGIHYECPIDKEKYYPKDRKKRRFLYERYSFELKEKCKDAEE